MDTNRLKRFATEARNILMQGVAHRLQALGFQADGTPIEDPQLFEGGATFMGDTVSKDFYDKWQSLHHAIERSKLKEVAEEAAYTWFNRLMAIRIMVKNGLIPPVLQYESEGVYVPLLVTEARQGRLSEMKEDERRKLLALLEDDSKTAEQFAILIVAFCHTTPVINACFGQIADYTELLLPTNILAEGGFIDLINHTDFIAEEDYKSPELIGWLYQFYISEKKDDVFASFKKGKKAEAEDIPAATQIFTPNWIVKYMVQNTIGRIYLDNNPYEEDIQKNWKYLVEPSEKTPDDKILRYDDLKELKFGDLACGSGHILNEGFDILYDLYILEGYSRSQAIENIFRYNLTGIDIDTRAKQLAQFALLLKACQKDSSFADAHVMPKVLDMPKVDRYTWRDLNGHMVCALQLQGADEVAYKELDECFDLMKDAECLGSIMKMNVSESTRVFIKECIDAQNKNHKFEDTFAELFKGFELVLALTEQYSALVMNPPYMGSSNMNHSLLEYAKKEYSYAKGDLMTMFMVKAMHFTSPNGMWAMINLPSWMFIASYREFRNIFLDSQHIESLLHLGRGVFGSDFGSVSFVIRNGVIKSNGTYRRLFKNHVEVRTIEKIHSLFMDKTYGLYSFNQDNFKRVFGSPLGYWVPEKILSLFNKEKLKEDVTFKEGLTTANNELFLRFWHEINHRNFSIGHAEGYWIPYNKGGAFRKWYGNNIYVINWTENGNLIKNYPGSSFRNPSYQLKEGGTYSALSSGDFSARYSPCGFAFDSKGTMFFTEKNIKSVLQYCNSKIFTYLTHIVCPTIDFRFGTIQELPNLTTDDRFSNVNIELSKLDWDSHETSWDFEANPLIALCNKYRQDGCGATSYRLENFVKEFETQWEQNFNQLHENEEELNRQFIEIYGLQDELTPDVSKDEITILQQGEISIEDNEIIWHRDVLMKQLLSYAVGCMMGRYSIDKSGLILANQGDGIEQFNEQVPDSRFEVDDDGIVPLMSAQSDFADNATVRFKQWLSVAFGPDMLVENLNFIEKCLGKSVDDYFVKDFWKDHKKMYQNRPIYWLFSSKKGAFQCLAYMHRMDAYTAERIRTKYLLPHIEWLMQKQGELEGNAANLSSVERKQLDNIVKQIAECREYHDRLHVIADQQIAFDLDDGVVVNYAKFDDVLTKIK